MEKYIKITKQKALALYLSGEKIILTPSKMRPTESPFSCHFETSIEKGIFEAMKKEKSKEKGIQDFSKKINSVSYYMCSKETGKTISFFIENK